MNQYQALYNKPPEVVILDVAVMLEDLQSELADFMEIDSHTYINRQHYTHREVFRNAWLFLQSDMRTDRVREALMIDLCAMCTIRRKKSIERADRAVALFTERLIGYCIGSHIYDSRYGMMYDFGGWVNDFIPYAVPLGANIDLSPPQQRIASRSPYASELSDREMQGYLAQERYWLPF